MIKEGLFNFVVQKDTRSITVERSFRAPLDPVWSAWTEAELLCKWWAPKPYECVITSLDFRTGGRWSYYMQGPEGDKHHCFFDYAEVRPKSFFSGTDGFTNEHGVINNSMPRLKWANFFSPIDGGTIVRIAIDFDSPEDLEKIIQMGFKEGFSMGLDQLEELLAH